MSTLEDALFFVRAERARQDAKWGSQRRHSDEKWLAILTEEVGEAATEVNERDETELFNELVQVAAVAVCWIEALVARAERGPVGVVGRDFKEGRGA